jgi:hypothetical protein
MTVKLRERPADVVEADLIRLGEDPANGGSQPVGASSYHYYRHDCPPLPFKGRRTVDAYPADWPHPDDEDAERLWDETEE